MGDSILGCFGLYTATPHGQRSSTTEMSEVVRLGGKIYKAPPSA
jgi:hypothetical protein